MHGLVRSLGLSARQWLPSGRVLEIWFQLEASHTLPNPPSPWPPAASPSAFHPRQTHPALPCIHGKPTSPSQRVTAAPGPVLGPAIRASHIIYRGTSRSVSPCYTLNLRAPYSRTLHPSSKPEALFPPHVLIRSTCPTLEKSGSHLRTSLFFSDQCHSPLETSTTNSGASVDGSSP